MPITDVLLTPFELKGVEFRNRIISTSHAPAYAEDGLPGERYQRYHEEKARGGLALTMFGGSSIVAPEVSPIYSQIDVSTDAVIGPLREFARRIHRHGARLMCQISHMGRRTASDMGDWIVPIAPSAVRDPAHHAVPRAMELEDIERIVGSYAAAARRCAEGGLDGVEVFVPSHLPGQFLDPTANLRSDAYGGSLENRMRFLREVLEKIRATVPQGFLVSLRMAIDESSEGGPAANECVEVAQRLYAAQLYDLLNLSGLAASTNWGLAQLIAGMSHPLGQHLEGVGHFRRAVGAPVIHAGRLADVATAAHALNSGAADLVGMTRAHMADPYLVEKLRAGAAPHIRPCVGAAYCIDRVYAGRDALCLHNPATGREERLPQQVQRAHGAQRRVVVIGGGPAGLEAARVAALRGHAVVLFEAGPQLGGQVLLAARAAWRRDLIGITHWLAAEVERLGVELRFNVLAEAADVLAESPDVVVIACGGVPRVPQVPGAEHALSTWDVLSAPAPSGAEIVLYDEDGGHAALSVAEHLARAGNPVTFVTPDRLPGRNVGGASYPVYLAAQARLGVKVIPNYRLAQVERHAAGLRIGLVHEYSREPLALESGMLVAELGSAPNEGLYQQLRDRVADRI